MGATTEGNIVILGSKTSWQEGSWIMYEYSLKDHPYLLLAMMVMSCQLRKSDRTTEKRKGRFKATVVASAGGDCDDTAVQPKAKKKIPRKTDDKLVAADSISTPASMSLHDVMDDPDSFINRINVQHHSSFFHFFDLRKTHQLSGSLITTSDGGRKVQTISFVFPK